MSTTTIHTHVRSASDAASGRRAFACAVVGVAVTACLLAGWAPLGFSIVTVFLFAGPHNWMEARYFLARMPARWGPLRTFFLTGIGGVLALTGAFTALPWVAETLDWSNRDWLTASATWDTAFILWIMTLAHLRSRQPPRRDWSLVTPAGFSLIAVVWMWPQGWSLALVYLHPLVALVFLDRELAKRRPEWHGTYRRVLVVVPLLLAALWWRLWDSPMLPGDDALSLRIAHHAGSSILSGVSSHLLVATHTFLEMLHYGAWLVAIPLVGLGAAPWRVSATPLGRRSPAWRKAVVGILCTGGAITLLLWAAFLADYPLTRDIYFTVAMLHVLAEVPFLLRLL